MFPFCINIEDLRTMIDDFVELSSKIYLEEECWEADMYAIVISAFKNNIKIEGSNFGCCTNWNKYVNLDFKMVHYPSKIFNNKNNKIFYKQDFTKDTYTIPWILNISPNQTKNKINYQLIATIKEFISLQKIRTNCPDMLYWNSDVTYNTNSYRTDNKYVILKPWSGGFNNIRMSFEIAACIAYRLNRILIIPEAYKMYLLENSNSLDNFFERIDYKIKIQSMSTNNFQELEKISKVYEFKCDEYYINLSSSKSVFNYHKDLKEIVINNDDKYIYFKENLLGNFYSVIHDDNILELKHFVYKHIHYKECIFAQAYSIVEYINNNFKNYYSIHLRRNDFQYQYKDLCINNCELLNNIKNHIPKGSTLYIATDLKDKDQLGILCTYYNIIILKDVENLLNKYINIDLYGMIEQIVCSRAIKFIGTKNSTFSSYIYRLRGYMKDILDKSYIINTSPKLNDYNLLENNWSGNQDIWAREYENGFTFNNYPNNNNIFVSIASYRDNELEKTIEDLFSKAKYPEKIYIGVCIQDTDENIKNFRYKYNKQVRVENIHYSKAKGVCYARNLIQTKLLQSEKFFLQIDSHTRFNYEWDINLIRQLKSCNHKKPILSCYPNGYTLNQNNNEYLINKNLSKHKYIKFWKIAL